MAVVNTAAKQRKQSSLIAGIAALVSIVAFLLLPYFNFTVTVTNNYYSGPQPQTIALSVGTGLISVLTGLIWIDALLAIAILVIAALLMWRDVPFGASTASIEAQVRRAASTVIILGLAGIAFHFLFVSIGSSQINNLVQSLTIGSISVAAELARSNTTLSVSMDNAIGSWIYILGMGGAIVGGVLMLRTGVVAVSSPQMVAQPQSWPQFPEYSQPFQPQPQAWPQPSQPQPQIWQPTQVQQPQQQGWQPTQVQQPQQQGWQPTQVQQPQQAQGWPQSPQTEQRWQQPPSFPSS